MGSTQTRPGGRIVAPYRNDYSGAMVALTVDDDGRHASGRVVDDAAFMWLRAHRPSGVVDSICEDEEITDAERSVTDVHPYWIGG